MGQTPDEMMSAVTASLASRIEGLVVVQLEKFPSGAGCQDANEMKWWLLP